ncbi:GAF domain-containing protein [Streptomyces sp. NPDC047079]|uniref:GAF domain-containing protein n=1 Tax=Streptomyces sp. NPDC047079 TaxID=3154607 RepID=UPI0034069039
MAAARIGTTLDEDTTCAELVREVAGQVGGAAAVLRGGGEGRPRYQGVAGNSAVLPGPWSAAAAVQEASGPRESGLAYPVPGHAGVALCVPLAANGHCYGVLVSAREGTPLTYEETEVLALLAERAASHIRHAREHDAGSGIVGKLVLCCRNPDGRIPILTWPSATSPSGRAR